MFEFLGYLQTVRPDWRASLAFYEISRDALVNVCTRQGSRLTRREQLQVHALADLDVLSQAHIEFEEWLAAQWTALDGLKVTTGQWSVTGEKTNEPTALRNHLSELLEQFPLLRLITGDAIYAQRPLAEALQWTHGLASIDI